jgi:hypothetical protein
MLYEMSKNSHKVTTIAAIRREAKEAARRRRDHESFLSWRFAEQKRLQEVEIEAKKQKTIEIQKLEHAQLLAELCRRLAYVYAIPCGVDSREIHKLLDKHLWACPFTEVKHSLETPLSIAFIVPLSLGGKLRIGNIVPRYREGLLAGEYPIDRMEKPISPETDSLPNIIQFGSASFAGAAA